VTEKGHASLKEPYLPQVDHSPRKSAWRRFRQIESREWWLWAFAVAVTLILTAGIISLTIFQRETAAYSAYWSDLNDWARGLAALVLLFDVYTMYQQLQLQRIRRQLAHRNQLFELITENAADMIAVVDNNGQRLYNSPAYEKVLGYSEEELKSTSSLDQIHPDDQQKVLNAAEQARGTGRGQRLEYRMRHKDQSWRTLESTASVIRNTKGEAEGLVIVNRDITERKRAEELLAHNALHDGLTDLPNRALFTDRVQRASLRARRSSGSQFAVLFIDVDGFKVFNDSLGHSIGDELLIQIGSRLAASFRQTDTISRASLNDSPTSDDTLARLGGDEFTVLLEEIREPSDAIRVAQRIQEKWATPFFINGQEIVITTSIGIALGTSTSADAEGLLRDAEIAMYRAKRAGKSRFEVFDPTMHSNAVRRLRLETDLRKAVELGEFTAHYQPIVSLQTGKITGFEALTRWQRPEGIVMPGEFISVADETGLIIPMNRLLMRQSCEHLRSWHSQFPTKPLLTMSVNITPKQFALPELASEIGLMLEQTGLDPACLQLEIMETIVMGDPDNAARVLSQLKALGVRLGIDDFGTGYSSLSRLQHFRVDTLKIDRAFISKMDTDAESHEIVRLIIMLAHNLGLKVVAEGTETEEQVNQLKQLGCEMAQGYFFSKPIATDSIVKLLSSFQSAMKAVASGA